MTREELQQVRDALVRPYSDECLADGCSECERIKPVLAILDAELAKPEAREWRVAWEVERGPNIWIDVEGDSFHQTLQEAESELAIWKRRCDPERTRNLHIESRTPAGLWKPFNPFLEKLTTSAESQSQERVTPESDAPAVPGSQNSGEFLA